MARYRNIWTDEQNRLLAENYGKIPPTELENLLNKNIGSIRRQAMRNGIKPDKSWTDKQNKILKDNYGKMPNKELARLLRKTEGSVKNRASILGLSLFIPWNKEKDEFLIANYGNISILDITKVLRVSTTTVNRHVKELGLELIRPNKYRKPNKPDKKQSPTCKGYIVKYSYTPEDYPNTKFKSKTYPTELTVESATNRAINMLENYEHATNIKILEVVPI